MFLMWMSIFVSKAVHESTYEPRAHIDTALKSLIFSIFMYSLRYDLFFKNRREYLLGSFGRFGENSGDQIIQITSRATHGASKGLRSS